MKERTRASAALCACCMAIFWPGAFIFSFPGVMGLHWQEIFTVGRADIGRTLFFVLAAAGIFMFCIGRWQEKIGPAWLVAGGATLCGASTILLGYASHINFVYLWAFLVGTLFAVSAPLASDCFGMQHFGAIFGLVFTAYGFVAGVLGPWLSGYLLDATGGNFILVFSYLGIFCLASSAFIWFAKPPRVKC